MSITKKYLPRLVDEYIKDILKDFTAVHIRGPKWCGKTSTSEFLCKSSIKLNNKAQKNNFEQMYAVDPALFLEGDKPRLIDEWQVFPLIWDEIKNYADETHLKNQFILTGSYSPKQGTTNHTGSMRIVRVDMTTMSLFESGDSSGVFSLSDLFLNPDKAISGVSSKNRFDITNMIVRGGWPEAIVNPPHNLTIYGQQALRSICDLDIQEASGQNLSPITTEYILRSISRNLSQEVSNTTIIKDVVNSGHNLSEQTFYDYYNALLRLFIINEIPAWCPNIRSKTSIRSLPKKEIFDPSLACAALKIDSEALNKDFKTRGFFFECLVARDLKVYSNTFNGNISYYRDRLGLECDFVIHKSDLDYCLIECKCGEGHIEEGANNLNKMVKLINEYNKNNPNNHIQLPLFRMIVTDGQYAYRRTDGIIVMPISLLKN